MFENSSSHCYLAYTSANKLRPAVSHGKDHANIVNVASVVEKKNRQKNDRVICLVALKTEASGGDASTVVVVVGQSIFFHRDRISRNKLDFNVDRNSDRNCRYPAAAATVAAATMLLRRNVTRGSLWDSETRTSRRKLIPHDETVTTGIDSRTVVIPGYTYTVFQDYLDTSFGYDGYPLINLKSICSFIKV